ncbi:hypothetical protein HMPREF1392_00189 [Helicobacter pylori GAM101Biv]|nr:hypothetical protein HMPREF1392_00189 [Helicobacter pylori GAM101Biv]
MCLLCFKLIYSRISLRGFKELNAFSFVMACGVEKIACFSL